MPSLELINRGDSLTWRASSNIPIFSSLVSFSLSNRKFSLPLSVVCSLSSLSSILTKCWASRLIWRNMLGCLELQVLLSRKVPLLLRASNPAFASSCFLKLQPRALPSSSCASSSEEEATRLSSMKDMLGHRASHR
ncbi:hypothetical protein AMTR_s00003p00267710 [Amborella trichopoda]|uniref:Uncharacterized protein n=1 Tax=Amborella trichopoda TaxID=13333 RepID=W1P797_AMBTC|nr:hypothetical protein AMTR_s00003p00267710 [Amborella trichopoda]